MSVRNYITTVLADLVEINSVNPAFSDGTTNERDIAEFVGGVLSGLGLEVSMYARQRDRVSVVGRLPGSGFGPSLMLYAHLDTVGVSGMHEPFSAVVRDGKLFGRGAYDMKGGLAACIAAVKTLEETDVNLAGDVFVAAVADEEVASCGIQEVLEQLTPDAAIVTESTDLSVCLAHKGFCWIDVKVRGRAAHGSRADLGVDANMRMGRFLGQLDLLEQRLRTVTPHPLLGTPSLHAATLRGGTGPSTYAAECKLRVERRTIPGETESRVLGEIQYIVDQLSAADPTFEAHVSADLWREPFEVAPDSRIVETVTEAAREVLGREPAHAGLTPWMDAAFLAAAGVETVVIGPAGAGAHGDREWVEIESVVQCADILTRSAVAYCG